MGIAHEPAAGRTVRNLTLLAAAALLLLAGCASRIPSNQAPHPSAELRSSAELSYTAAQRLCSRFTVAALASDAGIDRGPSDARHRAAQGFGTPALLDLLAGEGRDHTWTVLIQHDAHVQVSTEPVTDDPPLLAEDVVGAGVIAYRRAVGSNGWRQALPSLVAYCTLTRTQDHGWRVAQVTFADLGAGGGTP